MSKLTNGGPKKAAILTIGLLALCLALLAVTPPADTQAAATWNPKAAATYLDYRETWWMGWSVAARDHQTFCISCHSAVPYALARPALRAALGETGPSADERQLLANVRKRVELGNDAGAFFSDQEAGPHKTAESHSTEAVLNALVLASDDARTGRLTDDTRAAFRQMWALQETSGERSGAWLWLRFHLQPWEADDSDFFGAALAAVAVGTAPEDYRNNSEIQNNLKLLRDYLGREYPKQSLINRALLLWAGAKWPGLLTVQQQASLIEEIGSKQQADGGWSLASLAEPWKRADGTALETRSDGYATGLVAFALEQAGLASSSVHLKRALAWLVVNQNPTEGLWPAVSPNHQRDPASEIGRFMSDAATAYAVLALTGSR